MMRVRSQPIRQFAGPSVRLFASKLEGGLCAAQSGGQGPQAEQGRGQGRVLGVLLWLGMMGHGKSRDAKVLWRMLLFCS
jgi:hypothetical protein